VGRCKMNKPLLSRCSKVGRASRHPHWGRPAAVGAGETPALLLALALLLLSVTLPAQSLWKENGTGSLVADKRARAVGDIVNILVKESNSATKDNSTSTSKKSSLNATIANFLYSPAASGLLTKNGQLPGIAYDSTHTFDGGGKINNAETFDARIAVQVAEVLPNGNLVLEGTKKTSIAGETQDAVLRGVVRQEDITANDTVYSYNLADVTLKYVSKGSISDAQRKGWFTRIWDKLTPF
jgi:flagellar L-ring protein FlgH